MCTPNYYFLQKVVQCKFENIGLYEEPIQKVWCIECASFGASFILENQSTLNDDGWIETDREDTIAFRKAAWKLLGCYVSLNNCTFNG